MIGLLASLPTGPLAVVVAAVSLAVITLAYWLAGREPLPPGRRR